MTSSPGPSPKTSSHPGTAHPARGSPAQSPRQRHPSKAEAWAVGSSYPPGIRAAAPCWAGSTVRQAQGVRAPPSVYPGPTLGMTSWGLMGNPACLGLRPTAPATIILTHKHLLYEGGRDPSLPAAASPSPCPALDLAWSVLCTPAGSQRGSNMTPKLVSGSDMTV